VSRRIFAGCAAIFAIAAIAASQLPNFWALRVQRLGYHPDRVYAGTLPLYIDDATADWSFMRQAREGRLLFEDLYTADDHPRNYPNSLLWLLGAASRVTGCGIVPTYNAAKVVFSAILLWTLYALSCRLFDRPGERLACFVMMVMTGGWEGPLAFLQRHAGLTWSASSPGWWMPEISTMFSMILFPHMVAGFAAIVGSLLLMLRAWEDDGRPFSQKARASCAAGVVLLLVTLFHPYDAITALATIWTAPLLFALAERRRPRGTFVHAAVATAVALPAIAYNLWLVTTNPAVRGWDLQNNMATPDAWPFFRAFGLNLVLTAGLLPWLRRLSRSQLTILAWVVSVIVLILLPFRFQRRMMGGLQIPLAALGCTAIALLLVPLAMRLVRRGSVRADALGLLTLGAALLLAPLYAVTPCYVHQEQWQEVRRLREPSWLPIEEFTALEALGRVAPPGSTTLSSYPVGNFVPAVSGLKVFLGHGALTVDSKARGADVTRFFSGGPEDDVWRRELLARWNIGFVLDTPHERALGPFDPKGKPWLEAVFSTGDDPARRAAIYRVVR